VRKAEGDQQEYFFIPESELIPHARIRKKREVKRTPVEAQRGFQTEMKEKGYRPKTFYISGPNLTKLEKMKRRKPFHTWNEFMNELIENL
jgi:hypothetical protein